MAKLYNTVKSAANAARTVGEYYTGGFRGDSNMDTQLLRSEPTSIEGARWMDQSELKYAEKEDAAYTVEATRDELTVAKVNEWIKQQKYAAPWKKGQRRYTAKAKILPREKNDVEALWSEEGAPEKLRKALVAVRKGQTDKIEGLPPRYADNCLLWVDAQPADMPEGDMVKVLKEDAEAQLGVVSTADMTWEGVAKAFDAINKMKEKPTDTWVQDGDEISSIADFQRAYLAWIKTDYPFDWEVDYVVAVQVAGKGNALQRLKGLVPVATWASIVALLVGPHLSDRVMMMQSYYGRTKATLRCHDGKYRQISLQQCLSNLTVEQLSELRGCLPFIYGIVAGCGMGAKAEGAFITPAGIPKARNKFIEVLTSGMVAGGAATRRAAKTEDLRAEFRKLDQAQKANPDDFAKTVRAYLRPVQNRLQSWIPWTGGKDEDE